MPVRQGPQVPSDFGRDDLGLFQVVRRVFSHRNRHFLGDDDSICVQVADVSKSKMMKGSNFSVFLGFEWPQKFSREELWIMVDAECMQMPSRVEKSKQLKKNTVTAMFDALFWLQSFVELRFGFWFSGAGFRRYGDVG